MKFRFRNLLPAAAVGALALGLAVVPAPAQQPVPLIPPGAAPAQPDAPNNDIDVLARGPVHEAYASSVEPPTAGPVAPKMPPDAIEELPPDQKPEGDNVQWLPGYWAWDDERTDFLWVSGFWRVPPPNHMWVPGSWREVRGGWQWVGGFWQHSLPPQAGQPLLQPEIQYLPPPNPSIEVGPSVPAPTPTSIYVPGTWMWEGRYKWRTGYWMEYRPNWVWVPAHFRWSPVGYVFIDGYWDYPLASRGVLFAPVYFTRPVYVQPAYVYTPMYVVSEPCMVGALFVRRGHGYYFGDYFEPRYVNTGYVAWCGSVGRNGGFAVGVGVGRAYHYDPLWSYYSVTYRSTPAWQANVSELYVGRYRGDVVRPARTLVQQNTVINNVTNVTNVNDVTNNITVVNNNVTVNNKTVTNVAMIAPLKVAAQLQPAAKMQMISADVRKVEATNARQFRDVGVQRAKLETAVVDRGRPTLVAADTPQVLKLDMAKTAVARAQVIDEKKAPPPPPIKPVRETRPVVGKIDAVVTPKVDPKTIVTAPPVTPKIDPKLPVVMPKVDSKLPLLPPKTDPKLPVAPPKVEVPKTVTPITPPKVVDPKLPVTPPPLPKVEMPPKLPVLPPPLPKVDPKLPPPLPKVVAPPPLPKVEMPPKLPVLPPPLPKVIVPPKVEVPPKLPVLPPPMPKVVIPPVVVPVAPPPPPKGVTPVPVAPPPPPKGVTPPPVVPLTPPKVDPKVDPKPKDKKKD